MKLGEFINRFSHNNTIRLLYKCKGGHEVVADSWDDVSMDWEVNKKQGIFRHYINNEVLGLATILFVDGGQYTEALNIVIEQIEIQPLIEVETKDETHSSTDLVRCPNLCLDGYVKHYPNAERALFDLIKCPFCKGQGEVTVEKAKEIEKLL